MVHSTDLDESFSLSERRALFEAELSFMGNLLRRPLFSDRTPNAFERLREYQQEVVDFERELDAVPPEEDTPLLGLEKRWHRWKYGVYQYLNTKLNP